MEKKMIPTDKLRQDAFGIFKSALSAVDPRTATSKTLIRKGGTLVIENEEFGLADYENIYVVGAGKAAAAMAATLEELLGENLTAGQIITKYGHGLPLKKVAIVEAGHPIPDRAGLQGTQQILELLNQTTDRDMVIAIISGGGSALMPLPAGSLSLAEKQATTQTLLACGADIKEINIIRKHLSRVKGGCLAQAAAPATLLCLIISDVIGDPLDSIASGLTVGDPSTFGQCLDILDKYDLNDSIPPPVLAYLIKGSRGKVAETPKSDAPLFSKVHNHIISGNRQAVNAASAEAQTRGYQPLILSTLVEGETREIARMHGAIAREIRASGHPIPPPACIITGGETTVTIKGSGLGGRNQEFALAAALEIDGLANTVIFSAGTDGTDGPTDAAGGIVDGTTIQRAREMGLDAAQYLNANNAYHFLQKLDELVITGPTLTNVMDVRLVLAG